MKTRDLEQVVKQVKAGDTHAFGQIVDMTSSSIRAYVCFYLADSIAADDILQETYLKIFQKLDEYEAGSDFLAWIKSIARLEALAERRRRQRKGAAQERFVIGIKEKISEVTAQEAEQVSFEADLASLDICIKRLPEKVRRLVEMKYFQKKDLREVSQIVGHSVSAVGKAIQRARLVLADCMKKQQVLT